MSSYADTSFLVSLYVLDANSSLAASRTNRARLPIFLTAFGELELTNAISLRIYRKELLASQAKAAHALIRADIESGIFLSSPLSVTVFERAKQIARRQTPRIGTRSLDVLHVASALELKAEVFLTFDRRQRMLAKSEGISVL